MLIPKMFLVITMCMLTQLTFSQAKPVSKNGPPISVENGALPTVAEALRQHHIELTNEALVDALQNPDGEIRGLAAIQLAETKVRDAIPDIVSAVNKEKLPLTRANIALALTQLGEETGFSVLMSMCNDSGIPGHFRTLAARYLSDVNGGSCLDAVLSILETDKEWSSHMAALDILPRFKNVSESDFRKMYALDVKDLTNQTPAVRLIASNTLVALGGDSAVADLQSAIAAETDEVVRTQMEADLRRLQEKQEKKDHP